MISRLLHLVLPVSWEVLYRQSSSFLLVAFVQLCFLGFYVAYIALELNQKGVQKCTFRKWGMRCGSCHCTCKLLHNEDVTALWPYGTLTWSSLCPCIIVQPLRLPPLRLHPHASRKTLLSSAARMCALRPFHWGAWSTETCALGLLHGCRLPLAVCKTARPSFWWLWAYHKPFLFDSTSKSQHVFALRGISHCYQQLGLLFCTALPFLRFGWFKPIMWERRSLLCNRLHRRISVCVCFKSDCDQVLHVCACRDILKTAVSW